MNFKILYTLFILNVIAFQSSCIGIKNEWENLESNFDHVLNVFGIINLDSNSPSFIGVYRTTDLDEVSQTISGVDTLYYCNCESEDDKCVDNYDYEICEENEENGYWVVDSIYGPAAFIQDASVFVSDDLGNSYEFTFIDKITWVDTIVIDTTFIFYGTPVPFDTTIFDTNIYNINWYVDTTGTFNPQPETGYSLSITATGFDPISGSLITPKVPNLDSLVQREALADTIISSEPFDIYWELQEDGKGALTGQVIYDWADSTETLFCSGDFINAVDLADQNQYPLTIWGDFCDNIGNDVEVNDYFVKLTSMDDNYYEYFIIGETGEYSNAILNSPTTKGRSVGIEGGFGFFGSIASDALRLKITP